MVGLVISLGGQGGRRAAGWIVLLACLSLGLSACKGGDYSGGTATGGSSSQSSSTSDTGSASTQFTSDKDFFAARVQPNLSYCRNCHVPGGVADNDDGKLYMLSSDSSQDYANLKASWQALGKGVDSNLLLQNPSGQHTHSGGVPWAKGGPQYTAMRTLLSCWDDSDSCSTMLGAAADAGGGDTDTDSYPLLGDPGKHFFVNELCDGAPDDTPIDWSQDPRRLISGDNIDNDNYAVYFNDPFEICHTQTMLDNQAKENAILVAQGKRPIHTAKAYAATCGEWRKRVEEGETWIAYSPTDTPRVGGHGTSPLGITDFSAAAWNNLWQVWGLPARPANFDADVSERYGHSPTPAIPGNANPNPYPIIDPASGIDEATKLSKTFGGNGHLPLGFAQGRDAKGVYNGKISLNCLSCHGGQIGAGEVQGRDGILGDVIDYGANPDGSFMGLPNTNTELGVLIIDLLHAAQPVDLHLPPVGYLPLVNTTRGTNAADTEIEAVVALRDFDTLNFSHGFLDPLHASFGDQDPPAWWWLHNKSRYLWFGGHSTDSARGNMYFGSVNGLSGDQVKENEGIFESVHDWTLTVEAPSWPYGYCSNADGSPGPNDSPHCINKPLAQQGAILFHSKDLWADGQNADIPRPHGNGSCASCHGAYSPYFAHQPGFLPDPKLIGMTGHTVPIEIINTDPAQTTGWSKEIRPFVSTFWWSYPDGNPDYKFPENKDPLTEFLDDYSGYIDGLTDGAAMADHLGKNLDGMGMLQPLGDVLTTVLGVALPAVPQIPAGKLAGRVEGICGFETKTVGYVTPPLHGVWASAPYFHNGSVPTIWDVLKPSDRPSVWRRQRTQTDVVFNAFEHRLTGPMGGYNFKELGWNYDRLHCGDNGQGIPYYTCQPDTPLPTEIDWVKTTLDGGLLWPTWVVPPPFGDSGLADRMIFNSNLYSKKNTGHEWTRVLTDQERRALMEYLKTL